MGIWDSCVSVTVIWSGRVWHNWENWEMCTEFFWHSDNASGCLSEIIDRSLMFSIIVFRRMSQYASASSHISPRLSFVIVLLRVQQILGAINYRCGFKYFVKYVMNDKLWSIRQVFVIVYVDYMFIGSCMWRSSWCKCCISQQKSMKCGVTDTANDKTCLSQVVCIYSRPFYSPFSTGMLSSLHART